MTVTFTLSGLAFEKAAFYIDRFPWEILVKWDDVPKSKVPFIIYWKCSKEKRNEPNSFIMGLLDGKSKEPWRTVTLM